MDDQHGCICPHCGSKTVQIRDGGYRLGSCGTEWFSRAGDVDVHLEPTIACKDLASLRARLTEAEAERERLRGMLSSSELKRGQEAQVNSELFREVEDLREMVSGLLKKKEGA